MPRIHTVAADGTITAGDKLIGSDGAENANFVTRNYTVGGIKDFILNGTHAGSFTTVTTSGNATIGGNLTITGNTTITGNLQVDGSTITFDDPILVLSGDTAPTSNNQKDTGIAFRWYESAGSGSAKIGFFGFDESTMKFTFVPDASISSEVVSGSAGTIVVKDVEAEEIYGYKFIDSQDNQYYVDPNNGNTSIKVAGKIEANNTDTINGININNSNQEMSGIGDVYANKYFDGQDDTYYLDPGHGGVSIKVAGKIEANNTDTINGININNTNQEMSGIGEIYAYKFIDSQTGSHYLDPGNSTLSLVTAGKVTIGAFTIPKTIGSAGQVLKVPSSGTELEWGAGSGLTHIQEGSEFYKSVLVGSSTTGTLDNARLNVGVGVDAIKSITEGDSNVAIGYNAAGLLTVGDKNIAIGDNALAQAPGSNENVAIGHYALYSQDATNNAQAYTVAVGMRAGYLIEHDQPFATCIGAYAGDSITTGQYNTIIGSTADVNAATDNNSIVIGALAAGHGSNIAVIGNGSITAWHPGGDNGVDLGSTSYSFKDAYVQGRVNAGNYKVDALNTAPSSASDTGTVGEIRYTADYIYVCVASNTWKRAAISTW